MNATMHSRVLLDWTGVRTDDEGTRRELEKAKEREKT